MSFWTEKWAYEQEPKSSGAKFVLVCLAHYADEYGFCYPSQKKLAAMTGMKVRTVRSHLAQLEEDSFVRREERRSDSGYRTSDGIYLLISEEELGLPAKSAGSETSPAKNNTLTGKKQHSHRQKTVGLYRDDSLEEPLVNQSSSEHTQLEDLPDDTMTRCLWLLLQVEGYPRNQAENALHLARCRTEFPNVDPVEVCKDFRAVIREDPLKKKSNARNRLRNFFRQAAKKQPDNVRQFKPPDNSARGSEPEKTRADYSWWFGEGEQGNG